MTSWVLLLGASIVLCIGALLASTVNDVNKRIDVARGERRGITTIAALGKLFEDASASRNLATDIRTVDALEAEHPLGGDDWTAVRAARSTPDFVDQLAALFPVVSDRSGLTYDPDVAGIDLADALTYRLPIAIHQFQHAATTLGAGSFASVAARLELARDAGHADGYLNDGLSEMQQATQLNADFQRAIGIQRQRTQTASTLALEGLSAFESAPSAATHRNATVRVRTGITDLYDLAERTGPALGTLLDMRIRSLREQRFQTIVLGIVALLGAGTIVVFGTRGALQRAELTRIKRSTTELQFHATHDALTGLPNRVAFVTAVDDALDRIRGTNGAFAVLFVDLDDFKLVNDSLGHEAGDEVLVVVARRLENVARRADRALFARFGGDEFALLVGATVDDIDALVRTAVAAIATVMADPITIDAAFDQGIVISSSVGIATIAIDGDERISADLLREADAAMYEAKAAGRARSETFGPAMLERATRKLTLAHDLRGASERGEFFLEFQPFVRLEDGVTMGSEALVRWNHPKLGLLMPGAFLPVAETTGAMDGIGRWVLDEALRLYRSGAAPTGSIHVNLSVGELLDERLEAEIVALLSKHGVDASALAIEVIEGSLIRSGDRAEKMLRRLRAMGTKIWIDDFGVEYSSLRYLHRLPIDGLKIDRTFVGGSDGSLASRPIVRAILELARSLELGVVAEGVETERQRYELLAIGCDRGQGYLYPAIAGPRAETQMKTIKAV